MAPPPTPFPQGWRPKARDDVAFRHVGEGWVLFDPVSQRIHVLDVVDALLWSFCTGESDVPALEEEVRQAFGPAIDDPRVPQALQSFLDEGLLRAP
jgi:hypothetical protein